MRKELVIALHTDTPLVVGHLLLVIIYLEFLRLKRKNCLRLGFQIVCQDGPTNFTKLTERSPDIFIFLKDSIICQKRTNHLVEAVHSFNIRSHTLLFIMSYFCKAQFLVIAVIKSKCNTKVSEKQEMSVKVCSISFQRLKNFVRLNRCVHCVSK